MALITSLKSANEAPSREIWREKEMMKKRNKEIANSLNKLILYLTNPIENRKIKINKDSMKLSKYKLLINTKILRIKYIENFKTTGIFQIKLSTAK